MDWLNILGPPAIVGLGTFYLLLLKPDEESWDEEHPSIWRRYPEGGDF